MTRCAVWQGTEDEINQLLVAVKNNCDCRYSYEGALTASCAPHTALLEQRFLDGLLWSRHTVRRLLLEEFMLPLEPD